MNRAGYWPLAGLLAVAFGALTLSGCGSSRQPSTGSASQTGGLSPEPDDPKEQLDQQRLAEATRGLSFQNGRVSVIKPVTKNRARSVALVSTAEEVTETDNTWFKSVGAFRDAVLADPTNPSAYEGLARGFLMEQMTDYAEAALRTAVALDPKFNKARFELGTVRQMTSDFQGAVNEWKQLIANAPDYPDVYARLAIASYYIHDYKAAYANLDEADRRMQSVPAQFRSLLKEAAPRP